MKGNIKPLINYHYCMKVFSHMQKHKLTMYIDDGGVLWHTNDLLAVLQPPKRASK